MFGKIKEKIALKTNQIMAIAAAVLLLACIVVICVYFAFVRPLWKNAQAHGDALGSTIGTVVGTAIGTRDGILVEVPKGIEDGKEQGLTAEDTQINIHENVARIGNLEVLQASVSMVNEHSSGDSYKKLEIMYGTLVFTTDLTQAQVQESAGEILILLPELKADLKIDEEKTKTLAEYAKPFLDGSAEDGFTASINSMKQIDENAEEQIGNYDALVEQAKSAALKNVKLLVEKISVAEKNVTVQFMEESGVS